MSFIKNFIFKAMMDERQNKPTERYEKTMSDMILLFLEEPLFYQLSNDILARVFRNTEETFTQQNVAYILANLTTNGKRKKDARTLADVIGKDEQVSGQKIADAIASNLNQCPDFEEKVEIPESGITGIETPSYAELVEIRNKRHIDLIQSKYQEVFTDVRKQIAQQQQDIENEPQRKEEAKKKVDEEIEEMKQKYKTEEEEAEKKNQELQAELDQLKAKLDEKPEQKAYFEEYSEEMHKFLDQKAELEAKLNFQIATLKKEVSELLEGQEKQKKKQEEEKVRQEKVDKRKKEREEEKKKREEEERIKEAQKSQRQKEQEKSYKELLEEVDKDEDEDDDEAIELVVPDPQNIKPIKLVNQTEKKKEIPKKIKTIFDAINTENIEEVKKFLPQKVNDVADQRVTPLILATRLGNFEIFKLLLENGANVNAQDAKGQTAFHIAAARLDADMISALSNAHARTNLRDANKQTPMDILNDRDNCQKSLSKAAQEGDQSTITRIIKKFPDLINHKYDMGMSLLHIAAGFNKPNACQTLIAWGADMNAVNDDGNTPLHLAVQYEAFKAAKFLLDHGADATIKNKAGKTALELRK